MQRGFLVKANKDKRISRNAVMKRRMLTAQRQIDDCCWSPPTLEGEHSSSWNDFVWLLPLLKFVVDIILSSAFPLSCRFLFFQRKMAARITKSLLPNQQSHQNLLNFLLGQKKLIYSGNLGVPLLWNSNKRQIWKHLLIWRFYGATKSRSLPEWNFIIIGC